LAADAGRPYINLDHARTRGNVQTKEEMARSIVERDRITDGAVCVLSVVEPYWSFQVRKSHVTHRLEANRSAWEARDRRNGGACRSRVVRGPGRAPLELIQWLATRTCVAGRVWGPRRSRGDPACV
jgi:hypothetical protein